MTDKELRKLKRQELMELLLMQSRETDLLREELDSARSRMDSRRIMLENAGSIAEASLRINKVFEDAQSAAELYLENLRDSSERCGEVEDRCRQRCAEIEEECRKKCEKIEEDSRRHCAETEASILERETEAEREGEILKAELNAQYEDKVRELEKLYAAQMENLKRRVAEVVDTASLNPVKKAMLKPQLLKCFEIAVAEKIEGETREDEKQENA